jgi:2-polyprenyl-6-methoxyphenol hydroxylase-like FAD-dependent oxidoreductase
MTTTSSSSTITIVGASITGLSLTLSLLHNKLATPASIKIYDLRFPGTADPANSSGVILTPNGLSVLSSLDVLAKFEEKCWLSEYRT